MSGHDLYLAVLLSLCAANIVGAVVLAVEGTPLAMVPAMGAAWAGYFFAVGVA